MASQTTSLPHSRAAQRTSNVSAQSNVTGGTPGGTTSGLKVRSKARPKMSGGMLQGQEYLWALVLLEGGAMWYLRHTFRAHHGG